MNIRRGLKIIAEAKSVEFKQYMAHARDFYDKYFIKYPEKYGFVKKTVFISTEEPNIITEVEK